MKTASTSLINLLASRVFLAVDLYALTLADGTITYYSGGDADVLWNGNTYSCGALAGPFWGKDGQRSTLHQKLGTDVDTFYVQIMPGTSTIKGVPWGEARRIGVFQGAWLQYSRAYFALPLTGQYWPLVPVGVLPRFTGQIGAIDGGGADMVFSVNSPMKILQRMIPRNLYQPSCQCCLGDQACGITLSTLVASSTVTSGSTALVLKTTLPQGQDYYVHGAITFTSGALNGFSRTVEAWVPGTLTLATPFHTAPAAGDSFTILPGCDKTFGPQGCPKFNNIANFRGHPYVPLPSQTQ